MTVGKLSAQDLGKFIAFLTKHGARSQYVTVGMDGPKISFTFEGDDGKIVCVNLFDVSTKVTPSCTKTESL